LDELGFYWGDKTKAKSFGERIEDRIEELKAFKEKHGHVRVTVKQDKSLATFCKNMRAARRGTVKRTVTDNIIKALDELSFDWDKKTKSDKAKKSLEERITDLKAFKETHGHVRVTFKQDKSLHGFCAGMQASRRGTGTMAITEDRMKSLDKLGFEWGQQEIK